MKMRVVGSVRATMSLDPRHLAQGKVSKTKVAGDLFTKASHPLGSHVLVYLCTL